MPDPNLPPETEPVPPVATPPAEPPVEPTPPAVDYEKKFADSTRENQLLQAKLAEEQRARQELTKEPTDSELRTAFPSWDVMDDTQKELATRTFGAERNSLNASRIVTQLQNERSWETSVQLALSSDPALQGQEQQFRDFASKPQYKNVPMDVLVPAFLQKQGNAPKAPVTTPKPGLEPGNGGPKESPKPQAVSADELSALRTSDPRAWETYIKTHEINIEI